MRICAVVTCPNNGTHTFPQEETQRNKWIKATRIDVNRKIGWHLRKYSTVCSSHFTPNDFIIRGKQRMLRKSSVPSIFPWTVIPPVSSQHSEGSEQPSEQVLNIHQIDSLRVDPVKVVKTYSRRELPFKFVEEYPSLTDQTTRDNVDPLQIHNGSKTEVSKILKLDNFLEPSKHTPGPNINGADVEIGNYPENQDNTIATDECGDSEPKCDNNHEDSHPVHISSEKVDHTCKSVSDSDDIPFSVNRYKKDNTAIQFYTGLQNFHKLMYVYNTLNVSTNLKYAHEPPPTLKPFEQFFITLMILKRHTEFVEISMLYLIPLKQVTNIFKTWIRLMASQWKNLDLWVSRETEESYRSLGFHDKHSMTKVILSATVSVKKPDLLQVQCKTFSGPKNRKIIKFSIGFTSRGLIIFVSPTYGVTVPDKQIIEINILQRPNNSDKIMDTEGQDKPDIFLSGGIKVIVPTVIEKVKQSNPGILTNERKVASKSMPVKTIERVIGMIKSHKILREQMNLTETLMSHDIVLVCAMLVNFRSKMISE